MCFFGHRSTAGRTDLLSHCINQNKSRAYRAELLMYSDKIFIFFHYRCALPFFYWQTTMTGTCWTYGNNLNFMYQLFFRKGQSRAYNNYFLLLFFLVTGVLLAVQIWCRASGSCAARRTVRRHLRSHKGPDLAPAHRGRPGNRTPVAQ